MTALPDTLNLGYSTRTKATVAGAATLGWILTFVLSSGDIASVSVVPYMVALLGTLLVVITVRSGYVIDATALHRTTWRGTRTYAASDFLGSELLHGSNAKPGVLLRFRTGIVFLSEARGCATPEVVQHYIHTEWGFSPAQQHHQPAGPVDQDLLLQYESIHIAVLAVATVVFAGLAALGSMFWVAAIGAVLTGRALFVISSSRRMEADHDGITIHRAFQPALHLRWEDVQMVRFWYSLAQGGMSITDGSNTIRVYRWIQNYPRFNRMVQDLAPASAFPTSLRLPASISLNERRYTAWVTLAISTGVSLWLALQDAWIFAVILTAVPLATHLYSRAANSRRLEIDSDQLRLIERKSFVESTRSFRRQDLNDLRLGRQLSAGGLWLKFGKERVEICNLDSQRAPEEILALLKREWQWDANPTAIHPTEFETASVA